MSVWAKLGQILLASLPTFFLVWILHVYVARVFFRPLQQTLRKRKESTEGLRKTAAAAVANAEEKTAKYQEALRAARSQMYQIQEEERQRALERRAETIRQAQARAGEMTAQAKQELRNEADDAKKALASDADQIATSIMKAILKSEPQGKPVAASVGGPEGA